MTYRVDFSDEAVDQISTMRRWWIDHGGGSSPAFEDAMNRALRRLERLPRSAPLYPAIADVRRLLLPGVQIHLYFEVDEALRTVKIVAVWHTARGSHPG